MKKAQGALIIAIPLIVVFTIIFFMTRKKTISREDVVSFVIATFPEQTGFSVSEVNLIKTDDYTYTGYVILDTDKSQPAIKVTIDKDNPEDCMWECTSPSPIMIQKRIQDYVQKQLNDTTTQ